MVWKMGGFWVVCLLVMDGGVYFLSGDKVDRCNKVSWSFFFSVPGQILMRHILTDNEYILGSFCVLFRFIFVK